MQNNKTNSNLTYFGILRATTSWAKVCRELIRSLIDLGTPMNIYERKGFLYQSDMALPPQVQRRIDQQFGLGTVFTFEHPNTYKYLKGNYKVGILTYESTVVPQHWISQINTHLDLLIVPSTFCQTVFEDSGVERLPVRVLPHGFDPQIYRPSRRPLPLNTRKHFRFLSVLSPHKREGLDLLLHAYRSAFTAADDVALIIKVNYMPPTKSKPFEIADLPRTIGQFQDVPTNPEILYMNDFIPESDMGRLYGSAACHVSATRGEGFGMTFLESLACGLDVIATGWGGHLDFLSQTNAHLTRYTLRRAKEIQYDCQDTTAQIAHADTEDLANIMRTVSRQDDSHPQQNPNGLEKYHWKNIAIEFLNILHDLTKGCMGEDPQGNQFKFLDKFDTLSQYLDERC